MQAVVGALAVAGVSIGLYSVAAPAASAHAPVTHCQSEHCGLAANGTDPNYVIGILTHVGKDADLKMAVRPLISGKAFQLAEVSKYRTDPS